MMFEGLKLRHVLLIRSPWLNANFTQVVQVTWKAPTVMSIVYGLSR